jgi:hypothetical protein
LLIAFRIALPYILLRFVNKELQTIPGYTGHVDDIDVHLIRGAYTIKVIKLDKTGGKIPVPFFSAEAIDLSVEWSAIFHGRLVGKIIVQHPIINFAKGPRPEGEHLCYRHPYPGIESLQCQTSKGRAPEYGRGDLRRHLWRACHIAHEDGCPQSISHLYPQSGAHRYGYYIKDLHVVNWKDDKGHPLKLAYEAVVGAVAWVIKNHGKDQLATKASSRPFTRR